MFDALQRALHRVRRVLHRFGNGGHASIAERVFRRFLVAPVGAESVKKLLHSALELLRRVGGPSRNGDGEQNAGERGVNPGLVQRKP